MESVPPGHLTDRTWTCWSAGPRARPWDEHGRHAVRTSSAVSTRDSRVTACSDAGPSRRSPSVSPSELPADERFSLPPQRLARPAGPRRGLRHAGDHRLDRAAPPQAPRRRAARSPPGRAAGSAGDAAARPRGGPRPARPLLRLAHRPGQRSGSPTATRWSSATSTAPRSTLRYRANRLALGTARAAGDAHASHDARLTAEGRRDAAPRADRYDSLLGAGRQILAFDPTGRGRAAEVFGDLGTAERVSVVVPGVDTDLLTFERDEPSRTPPPSAWRASLYAAERAADPAHAHGRHRLGRLHRARRARHGRGHRRAAPSSGAVRLHRAGAGAARRARRVSLFCHSYGSVVCGVAAPGPARRPGLRHRGGRQPRHARRTTPPSCAPPPACGRCGTATTGSRTCRTWRSAGSATAPTRSPPAFGARVLSRRGRPGARRLLRARAPTACANFAEHRRRPRTPVTCGARRRRAATGLSGADVGLDARRCRRNCGLPEEATSDACRIR